MTDHTALGPCEEVARLLTMFDQLGKLDVAEAITQAGGDAECVSPDYGPDDADQAVELADPILVAEVNATLGFLAEHGPGVVHALVTLRDVMERADAAIADTFGPDLDDAVYAGLRIQQRVRACYALADDIAAHHPDNVHAE